MIYEGEEGLLMLFPVRKAGYDDVTRTSHDSIDHYREVSNLQVEIVDPSSDTYKNGLGIESYQYS
ncbi:11051_t:CDS:2 [Funneliformis geosporum]|uniref:15515_t:CDS:1 n=1 Tax=Funneliformis geosporum TaxID=1117311 RepID=A0A9W4WYM6_9GLOM|nr:15515_t:CDS:2 [Funneliformis geosporum]CAI2175113.1 11051_t:CDS:2 [Funneliformis geosporum]